MCYSVMHVDEPYTMPAGGAYLGSKVPGDKLDSLGFSVEMRTGTGIEL